MGDFQPIRIKLEIKQLERDLEGSLYKEKLDNLKTALNETIKILNKLIMVKPANKITLSDETKQMLKNEGFVVYEQVTFNDYSEDLILFIKLNHASDTSDAISIPKIYQYDGDGKPIVGRIIYNFGNKIDASSIDNIQAIKIIFLHEITHILGFEENILRKKSLLSTQIINRIDKKTMQKTIYTGARVISRAKKYFGCDTIAGLELEREGTSEGGEFVHWEARLLLGDYMTSDLYYPEQVISEFTLALLEDLGWYKVNYYTGGLMKFGKNKGCSFFENDCIYINGGTVSSRFSNEFCSLSTYGTCTAGRQSRGYCYTETSDSNVEQEYTRSGWEHNYGIKNVDYCPVTKETRQTDNLIGIFNGNCYFGNDKYGNEIRLPNDQKKTYEGFSGAFAQEYGDHSFCALSSIIEKNSNVEDFAETIRPTCYPMSCSEQSLTIKINYEYIVCPREGGMIRIEKKEYTNYVGYLFCPDYNLICTGTKMCNDLFDCVVKESEAKNYNYDYKGNNVSSQITSENRTETQLNGLIPSEGFELSNDINAICPQNCRLCKSNKICTLCKTFNKIEPHAYYIGKDENNPNDSINCAAEKPALGYYLKVQYEHHYYFKCTEDCNYCKNANECDQCRPTHYIRKNDKKCEERIPHCSKYNESTLYNDTDTNNGGLGYRECENCNNEAGYYCVNMNKTYCDNSHDYTLDIYYKMEDREKYSCVGLCDDIFPKCIKCTKNECSKCDLEHYVNHTTKGCDERIPHCKDYNTSSKIIDKDGNEGYSLCSACDNSYYCIKENKSICEYIKSEDIKYYYDYGNGCKHLCEDLFPYCETCVKTKCESCLTFMKTDGSCTEGIPHCKRYNKVKTNETYSECSQCDNDNGYYCIDMKKTSCEKIDEDRNHYYSLEENEQYPCIRKCSDQYPECSVCNNTHCIECKKRHVLSLNATRCLFEFEPLPNDVCRISVHEHNVNIEDIDFMYFIDYYFDHTFYYLKTVDHFVGKDYTVTMFIHSECTEELLNLGYFKIDSNQLYNTMIKEARIETNEFIISLFIAYKNQNHFRFHNIESLYIDPEKKCKSCFNVPFTITNKYNKNVKSVLGPILSEIIISEEIDIFSKDSDVYTNPCVNVTLKGIDIPVNERYNYLYLKEQANKIACSGSNCEIEEINTKEGTSTCKCKFGNKKEDLFNNQEEEPSQETSEEFQIPSSVSSLKCMKNGFKSKNIKENGGFYICLISLAGVGGLSIIYFLFSKTFTRIKSANPPARLKHPIKLISTWGQENTKKMRENEKICDFQPRDEREEDFFEEEGSYYDKKLDSLFSCSFESRVGDEKNKEGKKVLVLLRKKKTKDELDDSVQVYLSLNKSKQKPFCMIYWFVLSIKQHVINWFSFIPCFKITESYIPLPIKIMRSLFIIVLSFLFNSLFLTRNYFSEKFKHFNQKYKLLVSNTEEYTIAPGDIDIETVISSTTISLYSFTHTIVYALIVFAILLVIQLVLGLVFFNLRKEVKKIIEKKNPSEISDLEYKTRIKNIIFIAICFVTIILALFAFIGFGGIYGGGVLDYFIPGIMSLIFLEIFPFLWSLVIASFRYFGIKKGNKILYKISEFLIF